jgi:dolichyl-diphosphooligosaccharide--protein glycosyltransferase
MAAIISALTFGKADTWWIEAIGALLPVFIGGLLPLVIYLIVADITDQFTAVVAGMLTALLPMTIHYAQIGNLDHHFFAALCQGLFWLTYLRASRKPDQSLWAVLAGIVLLIGFTSTTEFPFVVAIHCSFLFLIWFKAKNERRNELILINTKIFATTTILLLPCVFTRYFEPNGVSPLVACSWLGTFLFFFFLVLLASWRKIIPYFSLILTLLLTIICIFFFDFSLISKLLNEFQQSQGNNILANLIKENDPIIFAGLKALLYWESGFLLLVPFTVYFLIRRSGEADFLVLVGLLIVQPLTLAHERFGVLLTVPFVIGSAILIKETLVIAKEYLPKNRLGEILVASISLLAILPCLMGINFSNPTIVINNRSFAPLYETFTWLKLNTPRVNAKNPEYGVLANQWDLGHWIVYFAERPTVSSPLLHTPELAQAVFDSSKIFVQPPTTALKVLESRKLRYLLITQDDFLTILKLAGQDTELLKQNEDLPKKLLYNSLYGQLLLSYGFGLNDASNYQVNRFRLVYETTESSTVKNAKVPICMVFEIVNGAHLTGYTKAGTIVTATTQLKTPSQRAISYSVSAKTDESGFFDLVVPYSTDKNTNNSISASYYILKTSSSITSVEVKETQVRNGETIKLQLSKD